MAFSVLVSSFKNGVKTLHSRSGNVTSSHFMTVMVIPLVPVRNNSYMEVSKNLTLISKDKKKSKIINGKLDPAENKPLVVMISWLMAKKKHVSKYADIYTHRGFDVLNVSVNPWQFLWPAKGTQVVAADILRFLDVNTSFTPLLLHGFSVGGYLWGEVMVQMAAELGRYQHVIDRVAGQIWDSAADITEIPIGVPVAVFPRNAVMQMALRKYILYHMKTFDKVATQHYVRSSQMFHTNIIKAPAQFFLSKSDPIGAETSNLRVKENWESMGIPVYWKCWDHSAHVGHFRKYPKQYTKEIHNFLDSINLVDSKTQRVVVEKRMQRKN